MAFCILKYFFLFFPEKKIWHFLHTLETICIKCKTCFLEKLWQILQNVFCVSYFSMKTRFDISFKQSPMETICLKYQNLFSWKNKKKYFKMSSAEFFTQQTKSYNQDFCIFNTQVISKSISCWYPLVKATLKYSNMNRCDRSALVRRQLKSRRAQLCFHCSFVHCLKKKKKKKKKKKDRQRNSLNGFL